MEWQAALGMWNGREEKGDVVNLTLEMVNEREWVALNADRREAARCSDVEALLTTDIMLRAGAGGTRYMPEVGGCAALWLTEGNRGYSSVDNVSTGRLLDQLAGICFARAGMLDKALTLWSAADCTMALGHLAKQLLPKALCFNLMAEAIFGNGGNGNRASLLTNRHFWGLPGEDPCQVYADGGFYFHPAGRSHQNRERRLPFLQPGQPVILEAEPQNPHDTQAVHVWTTSGGDLGYVPRAIAATIAFHMRRGVRYNGKVACLRPSPVAYRQLAVWVEKSDRQ